MVTTGDVLELITTDDVVDILTDLGSHHPREDRQGNLYFTTICHCGEKRKLQYFTETKFFSCYTNCGSMSLFDLLMNANNWTFTEAKQYLAKYKGIDLYKRGVGLQKKKYINEDLDFLNKHLYKPKKNNIIQLPSFDERILNLFSDCYPADWEDEGITEAIAQQYEIKFYFNQCKAIIPHRDINGNLVGVRGRNYLQQEIDAGRKYIPVTVQGLTYRYPSHFNLYGLWQNKNNINKFKRAILFESEKSVMKYGSYFGQENNVSVALMGMNMSLFQRDLLLSQDIDELVICFDKQYIIEAIDSENKDSNEYKEYVRYIKNLAKITKMFINYCNVSLMLCWDDKVKYKDCPIDAGKEVFQELYRDRYFVDDIEEILEMIE